MNLRPYQQHAVDAVHEAWASSASTLVVMPTGCGKTVVFSHVANGVSQGRIMVVAHREELINQAAEKLHTIMGCKPDIEMADRRADQGMFTRSRVVVSSVQTQNAGEDGAGRMVRFDPGQFGLLIIDEAHHATAKSYRRVIDHFRQNPGLKVLGVTATPDRADEAALGQVFESVAYDYEILDAINDGWLTPIEQRLVTVGGLDLSQVRTTAGDLNGADLAAVMEYESNLHEIASPTLELVGDRRALVFAASVAHAERLAEICNRHRDGIARWIYGGTPREVRREVLADYAAGKFRLLVNVGVFTEGFDDPGIQVIVIARPTKSRALYAQMCGRGTRPLPGICDRYDDADDRRMAIAESAKPCVEILDFVGNSGRHKLMSAADILGGNYDDAVVERARGKAAAADGAAVDMVKALKDAELELQKAAEAARRARLRLRAEYSSQQVDPFDVFQIAPVRERGWDLGKPISDKMRALLERQDIATERLTYAQARQLIGEIMERWDSGKCSYKQARLLRRYGCRTDVSKAEAKRMIDAIVANGWRRPEGAPAVAAATDVEVF